MEDMDVKRALTLFPAMLTEVGDPLKDFKKGSYEASFQAYVERTAEAMDAIEDAYQAAEEKEQLLQELAGAFVDAAARTLEGQKKRRQEELLMNYNMCLVVYVNPALLERWPQSGQPLAEELLRAWKERFPKTNLKLSDFATINGGFKRRFCYITTAVCKSRGRGDDCYELNLLRDYRDQYLLRQPDGEALVKEYYNVAPTVVKHIDECQDAAGVYEQIWQEYLAPCISLIEAGRRQECRQRYEEMVCRLKEQYFYTGKVENGL